MKTRKISIAVQLFLFILGASIVAALIVGGVSYSKMGRFLRQKTMGNVVEIAVIAAEKFTRLCQRMKIIFSLL